MIKEIRKPDETLAALLPPVRPQPGVTYVPSQFSLPFDHEGKHFVCNTLTGQVVEAELPHCCRAGEGWDILIEKLFLVPEGKDECAYYNAMSSLLRAYSRKKGYTGYTIMPTLACNARCVYCYEEGVKPVTMAPETVLQTVRYILDTHEDGRVDLLWFGGEPLLYPDIIGRICEGVRDAGLDYHSGMVSNGSLLSPEIIKKMTETWRVDRIQISMDGAESDYIARKRYRSYQDHYHRVIRSVSDLSEAGVRISIRCNVDQDNLDGIPAFIEDLKSRIACRDNVTVYLAPLFGVRSGENALPVWKKVIDSKPMIEAAGFSTAAIFAAQRGYRVNRCMADGSGVVIGPDGSLYACEHCPPGSRFGDIWRGVTDENARNEFCRTDRTREKCRDCPFLPECTSFASCPVLDRQCREVHTMLKTAYLRRLVDNDGRSPSLEEEIPLC